MFRNLVWVFAPFALLAIFYFWPRHQHINHRFPRKQLTNTSIAVVDSFLLAPGEIVDGLVLDNDVLWTNGRFSIDRKGRHGTDQVNHVVSFDRIAQTSAVVNFYVANDTVYYLLANGKSIYRTSSTDTAVAHNFEFPVTYFARIGNTSLLFMENLMGNGCVRLRSIVADKDHPIINDTIFSNDLGSGMRYSGKWVVTPNQRHAFFAPQLEDTVLCLDSLGSLAYYFMAIDRQDQPLKVRKEGIRFYMSPDVLGLRLGVAASDSCLYLSSFVYSDSQDKDAFNNNLTIDVYAISNGQYLYSFYIPNYRGDAASEFALSSNMQLYALYPHTIIQYDISKLHDHS